MTQLGRYEILQQLSRGSVADVLLARASGLEGFARHVVIKRIRPEVATDQRFVKAFLDEARIGASLNHQNIVQVFDIDEQQGAYFFAMEYVHGEDARKLLQKVRDTDTLIPFDQVAAIGAAAAAGLHYAHEHLGTDRLPLGLVHRDVSPGNILIGFDGSVKLVDFALARAALRSAKTRTGSLSGKAPYMSPELCIGNAIDRRSDIFSLGIVLYELATARRLFKGDNDFLTMASIVEGEIQPPSVHRPDLPPRLDAIIMRALAKDPAARFQTAHDLQSELEAFALDAQLRTSAKALSDFMIKVFGARVEPWHAGAPPAVDSHSATTFDDSKAGLVAAPPATEKLSRRLATDAVSPIAIARNIAEKRPDPGVEAPDEEPTSMAAAVINPDSGKTFGEDVATKIDMPPDQEETATVRGKRPTPARPTPRPESEDSELSTQRVRVTPREAIAAAPTAVTPRPPVVPAAPTVPAARRNPDELPTVRTPAIPIGDDDEFNTGRQPVVRADTDAADEATTVMPPLFPSHELIIPASQPEVVYAAGRAAQPTPTPTNILRNPNFRWYALGGVVAFLLMIGLLARACSSDRPAKPTAPDAGSR